MIRIAPSPTPEAPVPDASQGRAATEEDLVLLRELLGDGFVNDWVAGYADDDDDSDAQVGGPVEEGLA